MTATGSQPTEPKAEIQNEATGSEWWEQANNRIHNLNRPDGFIDPNPPTSGAADTSGTANP